MYYLECDYLSDTFQEGDLKNCDTFTPDDVAALAAIHAIFTGGVLVWFCVGTDPAWYCPPWW